MECDIYYNVFIASSCIRFRRLLVLLGKRRQGFAESAQPRVSIINPRERYSSTTSPVSLLTRWCILDPTSSARGRPEPFVRTCQPLCEADPFRAGFQPRRLRGWTRPLGFQSLAAPRLHRTRKPRPPAPARRGRGRLGQRRTACCRRRGRRRERQSVAAVITAAVSVTVVITVAVSVTAMITAVASVTHGRRTGHGRDHDRRTGHGRSRLSSRPPHRRGGTLTAPSERDSEGPGRACRTGRDTRPSPPPPPAPETEFTAAV